MNGTLAERAASAHERWLNSTPPLGLPKSLFWDVDPTGLDLEMHAAQIVERVVECGGLIHWKTVRHHYGDERMIRIVTGLRCLSPRSVAFCCVAFDLKTEDFRCCTSRPFPPAPWIY
jgi:hypothetical protein